MCKTKLREMLVLLQRQEGGATMVEYGLMVALIAAVCVTIVTTLGTQVLGAFTSVSGGF